MVWFLLQFYLDPFKLKIILSRTLWANLFSKNFYFCSYVTTLFSGRAFFQSSFFLLRPGRVIHMLKDKWTIFAMAFKRNGHFFESALPKKRDESQDIEPFGIPLRQFWISDGSCCYWNMPNWLVNQTKTMFKKFFFMFDRWSWWFPLKFSPSFQQRVRISQEWLGQHGRRKNLRRAYKLDPVRNCWLPHLSKRRKTHRLNFINSMMNNSREADLNYEEVW
jgi:hypothetical protein